MNILRKFYRNGWMVLGVCGALILFYLIGLYPWMNHWGLTAEQAAMPLPGDGTEPGLVNRLDPRRTGQCAGEH